jgi:hypothetical protein
MRALKREPRFSTKDNLMKPKGDKPRRLWMFREDVQVPLGASTTVVGACRFFAARLSPRGGRQQLCLAMLAKTL